MSNFQEFKLKKKRLVKGCGHDSWIPNESEDWTVGGPCVINRSTAQPSSLASDVGGQGCRHATNNQNNK